MSGAKGVESNKTSARGVGEDSEKASIVEDIGGGNLTTKALRPLSRTQKNYRSYKGRLSREM